ncbi:protein RICE SALT SENSITIVE 3 isoform X2 [Andrographis paniculata]|uniref:protein RICE SALT SENSITIVE 3 isoform X2 n=1 Tax=Andrographis paniculata TaxID=175694 RepID=UPI0021E6F1D1|nr:protein RICE SALT SENSITIVE 3 isoform X2 [Andrographis paniculata]
MEEQLSSLAVTHLLQHTLRSLCIHENSQWVYAVFWRILPRNYPPPKWDSQGGVYDRSRGNRRNWILVWEDGFCNFAASTSTGDHQVNPSISTTECQAGSSSSSSIIYPPHDYLHHHHHQGLQPELFFKMSHEIYNYGEGLIGKVAADHGHKWIHKEPIDQEINFLSAWHNSADSHPRTWEAQFQSGIKTIALIAVREGVIQLGAIHKVVEDLSYVVMLRKKFSYIESIPGVLLPHPSSSSAAAYPSSPYKFNDPYAAAPPPAEAWPPYQNHNSINMNTIPTNDHHYNSSYDHFPTMKITPSMSSLEALLSKLPSVVPAGQNNNPYLQSAPPEDPIGAADGKIAKEEYHDGDDDDDDNNSAAAGGESGGAAAAYRHQQQQQHYGYHHDLNVSSSMDNNGC